MQKPDRKISVGTGVGVALGVIVAWLISLTGVEVPTEVAAAFGALFTGLIAYFVPNRP